MPITFLALTGERLLTALVLRTYLIFVLVLHIFNFKFICKITCFSEYKLIFIPSIGFIGLPTVKTHNVKTKTIVFSISLNYMFRSEFFRRTIYFYR